MQCSLELVIVAVAFLVAQTNIHWHPKKKSNCYLKRIRVGD